ncbi:MAG TPA: isoprenylcysteine carboxylmethyltransferase family protein [Candidatus Binatia bacterium]|nr:isoprenylcysteine carboxylmethyltransferase family protein [Candidatus Binatia bacterium]
MGDSADNPGVIAPPPLMYAGVFLIALALRRLEPLPIFGRVFWPGLALTALGVALAIWGRNTLVAAGTNVNPYRPSTAIVDSGPYRFTRNPLYVSLMLMYAGLTLAFDTWWGFILLAPVLIVMHLGVIRREERYLEGKFGESYRRYRDNVRRYL